MTGPVSGSIKKLYIFLLLLDVLWLFWLVAITFTLVRTFPHRLEFGPIIFVVVMVGLFCMYLFPFRVPFKTVLEGPKLTTYSLLGKRTVDLSQLLTIKEALLVPGRPGFTYAIKLSDPGSSLYIHLGSIPLASRSALYHSLEPYVSNPSATSKESAINNFKHWAPKQGD